MAVPSRSRRARTRVRQRFRLLALASFVAIVAVDVAVSPRASSAAAEPVQPRHRPPVDAPIVDPFRPPAHPFGPGNRGIDYATAPMTSVKATADGEVIFAGSVAGTLHVTIRHPDGLRTSYSFLASVLVAVGQTVKGGDVVGLSLDTLHLGVRDPTGTYLDPLSLFSQPGRARLVPGGDDGTIDRRSEAAAVEAVVAARAGTIDARFAKADLGIGGQALDLRARARLWAHLLAEAFGRHRERRVLAGLTSWASERERCTPARDPVPRTQGRRILVLVGGIGSTSEHAAVTAVDAAALGYASGDVVRFSYAGGRVSPEPVGSAMPLDRLPATPYTSRDSQIDQREAGDRLADLLGAIAAAEPGVPVDVVGHSQGGVVARLALHEGARRGERSSTVRTLVTLGSPHQGSDVAAMVLAGRLSRRGRQVEATLQVALGLDLDAGLPAGIALAPTSPLIADLQEMPVPASVKLVSIGARGDVVVPSGWTGVTGAPSTVVPVTGPRAHDRLPGAPEATREIGLAIAGRPPTCRSLGGLLVDLAVSEGIVQGEAAAGLGVAMAATAAGDRRDGVD
jgi:murein DD-endopeptidase MepM/ murein hydrolase activator NlpD